VESASCGLSSKTVIWSSSSAVDLSATSFGVVGSVGFGAARAHVDAGEDGARNLARAVCRARLWCGMGDYRCGGWGLPRVAFGHDLSDTVDERAHEQIAEWLKQGLSGVRMMELAREDPEHPYGGCGSVWRTAVRRERVRLLHEQAVVDVPIRFEGLPGEYLQVDWGEIRHFPFTQQTPVTRYFLACRLKYSRWTWVIFTDNMRHETLFRGLVACFNALGFVPWVLVFDNMKTVTTGRDDQQQPIWHRSLLQLAAEFDFHPQACWPASGNQKGSVESLVKFVKNNFLAGRSFSNDADLQAQCLEWQDSDNTTRPSQATDVTPASRLVEEVAKGYPLPVTATDYGWAIHQPG
jgi:transposase